MRMWPTYVPPTPQEMEAAAVAWAASLFNTPMFCVKAVTDIVDGDRPTQVRGGGRDEIVWLRGCASGGIVAGEHSTSKARSRMFTYPPPSFLLLGRVSREPGRCGQGAAGDAAARHCLCCRQVVPRVVKETRAGARQLDTYMCGMTAVPRGNCHACCSLFMIKLEKSWLCYNEMCCARLGLCRFNQTC